MGDPHDQGRGGELAEQADFADALAQMGHFIEEVSQTEPIHSALGYLTPAEFEAAWRESQPVVHLPSQRPKSVQLQGSTSPAMIEQR